jgi:hypothetical protein
MVWLRLKAACICAVCTALTFLNMKLYIFLIRFATLWKKNCLLIHMSKDYVYQVGFPESYGLSTMVLKYEMYFE